MANSASDPRKASTVSFARPSRGTRRMMLITRAPLSSLAGGYSRRSGRHGPKHTPGYAFRSISIRGYQPTAKGASHLWRARRDAVVRALLQQRHPGRAFDVAADPRRLRLGVEETRLGRRSATIAQR